MPAAPNDNQAELLEAHGYTLRHTESRTDEECEELRSWEVKDFPGVFRPWEVLEEMAVRD